MFGKENKFCTSEYFFNLRWYRHSKKISLCFSDGCISSSFLVYQKMQLRVSNVKIGKVEGSSYRDRKALQAVESPWEPLLLDPVSQHTRGLWRQRVVVRDIRSWMLHADMNSLGLKLHKMYTFIWEIYIWRHHCLPVHAYNIKYGTILFRSKSVLRENWRSKTLKTF